MNLTLPLPPTTNATYMVGNGRMYKSGKAQEWMNDAFFTIKKDPNHLRFSGPVLVTIQFNIKRDRDVDGAIKPLLDVLQHTCVLENDRQVKELSVTKNMVLAGENVTVKIREIGVKTG